MTVLFCACRGTVDRFIGDAVNCAARLESLSCQLGLAVLFDRATGDRVAATTVAADCAEGLGWTAMGSWRGRRSRGWGT